MTDPIAERIVAADAVFERPIAAAPLRGRVARAALASGGSEILTRVAMVGVSIATARALEPREVGFLGLAVIIVATISMVGYFPEMAAVALPPDAGDAIVATAATAIRGAVIAIILAVLFAAFPFVTAHIGGQAGGRELAQLVAILSGTLVAEWIGGHARVILQRRLDLHYVALTQLVQVIIFVALALLFLANGGRAMSLAIAQVIGSAAAAIGAWIRLLQIRVRRLAWPSTPQWVQTTRASWRMFIGLIGGFITERLDNVLVAGAIGPRQMSFYSMAWNASRAPASVFSRAISFVLIPALAHIQDDPARVRRAVNDCSRYSYILLVPICALLALFGQPLVAVVLGPKWLPLVPCLRIMAISVLTAPFLYVCTALLVGTGRAHLTAIATTMHIINLSLVIPPMARRWGIVGAAYGELFTIFIVMVAEFVIAHRATDLIHRELLGAPMVPIFAAIPAGALAWIAASAARGNVVQILVAGLVMAIAYPALLIALGGSTDLSAVVALLRNLVRRAAPVEAQS